MPIEKEQDLPPEAPGYAAGPLANQRPSGAGALLASGQSPDSYFAPKGIPILRPANAGVNVVTGIGDVAKNLMSRAASGIQSLFGTEPAATETTGVTSVADRTKTLESGLNELEMRSTGFKSSPNIAVDPVRQANIAAAQKARDNVVVVGNSAADEANAAFDKRATPTASQFNAQQNADQIAYRQQLMLARQEKK